MHWLKKFLAVVRLTLMEIGILKKDNEWFRRKWAQILLTETVRALTATGDTPQNYYYDRAEKVEPTTSNPDCVWVWYQGHRYGPAFVSWGPLDDDPNKSTVLIKTHEGRWVKLWFWQSVIE